MFKAISQSKKVSRKNLADKNLGMSYHDRLDKSQNSEAYISFFPVDCGNGYSRFEYFKESKI